LSKHLAKTCQIVGQVRMVVNPSAFMRAKSVRLHACSADPTYHKNRPCFQEALYDVLAPILGSAEVRQKAATGIYGGKLPSWWKDLETEKAEAGGSQKSISADAPRARCRYGAECTLKKMEHRKEFAHPGDPEWTTSDISTTSIGVVAVRPCCRHGGDCYRKNPEHRKAYVHPGDPDWEKASKASVDDTCQSNAQPTESNTMKPDRSDAAPLDAAETASVAEMSGDMSLHSREVRYDPDMKKPLTFKELTDIYSGQYSQADIKYYWETLDLVTDASKIACVADDDQVAKVAEAIPGLERWLAELKLTKYLDATLAWADEQGACDLEEIMDNLDDYIKDLALKKLEGQRARMHGASAMQSAKSHDSS